MNVLYLTYDGFNTPSPNNQMAEVIIKGLVDAGHGVTLVQSRKSTRYADLPESLLNLNGFTCVTIDRKLVDQSKFVKRYLSDLKYAFKAMCTWKNIEDVDVVYLQSTPTAVFNILLLRALCKKPIVFSIYDIFPGHAFDIGVMKSKAMYKAFALLQRPCYKIPRIITVLSEDMKRIAIREGADSEKIVIVPAWYNEATTHEVPWNENRFVEMYQIPKDKFYVQFAGTIGYIFNYEVILQLAERLRNYPEIVIQIVGDGNVKDRFVEEVKRAGLNNIEFYPLQPVELVPDVYSTCNLCIIPLKRGVIGNGVPSKLPILMACNRVVVSSVEKDSEYARTINELGIGAAVDIDDVDKLADTIIGLYQSPQRMKDIAKKANEYARRHYSSSQCLQTLVGAIAKAVGKA